MAFMNIEIEDVILAKLLANAVAKGESLDAYIERVLAQDLQDSQVAGGLTLEQALAQALLKVKKLKPGTEFTLQDLFADDWGQVAAPRWLGRRFRGDVEQAGSAEFVSKTKTNKAIYRRL